MEKLPGYRWVVFATWQVCSVSGWMMVSTIGILLPSISEELTLSPGEQGLLSSIAVWGNLGLAIPLSWLVSRYSPTLVSTITQLVATLFLFAQGWSPSFAVLLLGRLGLGMSLIAREPARALITQQWFPHREIPLVNGISNAVFSVIVGGGLIVTPFVLNALEGSWRSTFYLFGALFVVLSVFWIALGRDQVTTEYRGRQVEREAGVIRGALAYRDLWLAGLGFFGAVIAEYAFLSFFPTMMLDTYDVPLHWSGGLMALWLLGGGVFGLVAVYIASNTNNGKRLLQATGLLMVGTYAGYNDYRLFRHFGATEHSEWDGLELLAYSDDRPLPPARHPATRGRGRPRLHNDVDLGWERGGTVGGRLRSGGTGRRRAADPVLA